MSALPDRFTCRRHELYALPWTGSAVAFKCLWCGVELTHQPDLGASPPDWARILSEQTGDTYHTEAYHLAWKRHQPPPRIPAPLAEWPTVCRRHVLPGEMYARACLTCGHSLMLHPTRVDTDGACVICLALASVQIVLREAREGLPEWECPACGAVTRARLADHDHPPTNERGTDHG
jgi:predicted RNA-binding Zn-ribbon protein involved in translation (DUF1610 family)